MSYPSNWTKVKFCEIAKRKSVRIDNPKASGYEKYVGLEHLDSGELVVKRWGSTQDVTSNMQFFRKNDILFARRNTYLRRVSVALFDGVCSGDIIVIEPILKNIVDGFLPIYMQYEKFENRVIAWSAGAFSKRVKWKQLSEFEVWLPSKEKQQKIVDMIWGIQNNQEKTAYLLQVAEKLKKGLLEELLTKGIGHKKFKINEPGEIPEEWEIVKLSTICDVMDVDHKMPKSQLVGVPFISAKDLGGGTDINFTDTKFISEEDYLRQIKKCSPRKNDVLFSRIGAKLGIARLVRDDRKFGISYSLCIVRPSGKILPVYLETLMNSDIVHRQAVLGTKSIGVPDLALNEIKKFQVPLPTIEYQLKSTEITNYVLCYNKSLKNHLTNLRLLKKKLADSFLSGELLIPMEDLN